MHRSKRLARKIRRWPLNAPANDSRFRNTAEPFQAYSGSKTRPPVSSTRNRGRAAGNEGRLCVHALLSFALLCLVGCRSSGPPTSRRANQARRPNFVFILTDDQRFDSLGCAGNRLIQTPNIDRLAANGVWFRNHFVTTSICCVSRASIFTGQYQRRHGIGDFTTSLTAAQWQQTYPALLRAAGYRTGFIGKFGVGDAKCIASKAADFDFWRGLPGQAGE